MRALSTLVASMLVAFAAAECAGDNCANHVTGLWPGIGVPVESRLSMCNSYLLTTIKPGTTTVTSTFTSYTTDTANVPTISTFIMNQTTTSIKDTTIIPTLVPTFARGQCPDDGQFSTACSCWVDATAANTTLPRPTVTATETVYAHVGCGPAATGVAGGMAGGNSTHFPCSRRWGTCSCLFSDEEEVCVRVGTFEGGRNLTSGPCDNVDECDAFGGCEDEDSICVFDASCGCGKRRCYKAAPDGCDYQGLPIEEIDMLKQVGRRGIYPSK